MRSVSLILGAVIITFGLATHAVAAPEPDDPCRNAANDQEMRACRQAQLAESERHLSETFARLHKAQISDEPKLAELLTAAQAAWRSYRDVECQVRTYDSASGTAYDLYLNSCLQELNRERADRLQWMLDHP
jgi:uncharacterized protein YecT (DUF1311 family)